MGTDIHISEKGKGFMPGGTPVLNKDGVADRKFWKESLIGTKILFCGRGLKCFSPNRSTNSENNIMSCQMFSVQYRKKDRLSKAERP